MPIFKLLLPLALAAAILTPCVWSQSVDDASRYSSGTTGATRWMDNGHRGDRDFGMWVLETAAETWASAGWFIGSSKAGAGDIDTNGQSFGLYAHPAGSPNPSATATRRFAKPALTTGDTLSFRLAVNYRNGSKGFTLRNASGTSLWNFSVGKIDGTTDGYYIRNGVSGSAFDNGQRLGGYHADTIFSFTFTQRERRLDWTVERSGGITASLTGSMPLDSGTIADVRFFVTGTDGGALAQNNLYFNQLSLSTEPRGDAPLTIGERRQPGRVPSHFLSFSDPNATSVTLRHGGDNFSTSFPLAKGDDGIWSIDIRPILTTPGWHEFKFRTNSDWESGPNRWLYLDSQGRIAMPPAVYLVWQRDPTTTMTVHWHNDSPSQNQLRYRAAGSMDPWSILTASTRPFPFTERLVHTAEITGLSPASDYEFQADGYDETFRFRTLPATLGTPVSFGIGGDVGTGPIADAMTAAIASKSPDFLAVIGDFAYADGKAEYFWKWLRYFESWTRNARTPDGRLIPKVVGIGNHEVRYGYTKYHADYDGSQDWRLRYAPYFHSSFALPGGKSHGVLDFGDYLSLIVLDSDHSTLITEQTSWLASALDARRDRPHLIPTYHVPAYTSNRSVADEFSARIRQHWVPLFEQAGVQLVFEHHDHTFKRTKPLLGGVENPNGIRFLGDGLWGISSRAPDTSRSYLEVANQTHHVHLVTLTSTGRSVEAVNAEGNFFGGRIDQPVDGIPTAPASSLSSLSGNSLSIRWDPVPRAASYKVIRSDGEVWFTTGTTFSDPAWTPSSGLTYVVEAINRSGHSRNHPVVAPRPRELWRLANNLPWDGSGNGADLADPDGNGLPNLQEYFFGLAPGDRRGIGTMTALLDPDTLRFGIRYRRNPAASDTSHRILRKNDLGDESSPWSPVPFEDVLEETRDGAEIRRATIPIDSATQKTFLKLEVVPAP